jgi:hypothetical protein
VGLCLRRGRACGPHPTSLRSATLPEDGEGSEAMPGGGAVRADDRALADTTRPCFQPKIPRTAEASFASKVGPRDSEIISHSCVQLPIYSFPQAYETPR